MAQRHSFPVLSGLDQRSGGRPVIGVTVLSSHCHRDVMPFPYDKCSECAVSPASIERSCRIMPGTPHVPVPRTRLLLPARIERLLRFAATGITAGAFQLLLLKFLTGEGW